MLQKEIRVLFSKLFAVFFSAALIVGLASMTALAVETGDVFIDSVSGLTCQVKSVSTVEIINSNISGNYSIPATVSDDEGTAYTVTSIGDGAFANCAGLTSITIPDTVEYIYPRAFNWCTGLTNITASGTFYGSFEGVLYYLNADTASLALYPAGSTADSFDIPSQISIDGNQYTVNAIGGHSFLGASHLTTITIPEAIASIGDYAFYNCTSLKDVYFLAHMPNVGPEAFEGCPPNKTIHYPNDIGSDSYSTVFAPDTLTPQYRVTFTPTAHGTVSTDKQYFSEGDNVVVMAVPGSGYKLTSISYNDGARQVGFVYDFNMPASDVTITAVFAPITGGEITIPSGFFDSEDSETTATFENEIAKITVPANMLSSIPNADGGETAISVSAVNKTALPAETQAAVGDRPIIDLSLTVDGESLHWNNPAAPVSVCIPYTPTAEELLNPDSIVVYYIDGAGNLNCITNGHYDPDERSVTFQTTHFSIYAVGYNAVSYTDVPADAWYTKAVQFITAREITKNINGMDTSTFMPDLAISRGQFIIALMNAYGIKPAENPTDNFADAGNANYTNYLAVAKALGIVKGTGDNLFMPRKLMTRQEMLTMLYNALNTLGKLPAAGNGKSLAAFKDASQVDTWAWDAVSYFASSSILAGSNGIINPQGAVTRAQMAQVIYKLIAS